MEHNLINTFICTKYVTWFTFFSVTLVSTFDLNQLYSLAHTEIIHNAYFWNMCVYVFISQPLNIEKLCNNWFTAHHWGLPADLYPNQNTPGIKTLQPRILKRPCWKRSEIKMGGQGLLLLMELKFLIMTARLQNITVACHYNFRQLAGNIKAWSSLSKILIPSIAWGLGRPFRFHIFFSMAFFRFLVKTFYTRGVLVGISFLFFFFLLLVFLLKISL